MYALTTPNTSFATTQTHQGTVEVSGIVTGPPPSTAPTIEDPAPDTTFTQKSISVKGSCIANLIIRIYRNNFFAGSTLCQANGTFSLSIDLFEGKNDLIARQFDTYGQSSPDSNTVPVYYTPTLSSSPTLPGSPASPTRSAPIENIAQFQLIIEYDYTLQTIYTGKPFYFPVKFTGGNKPYAISITWGDDTNDVYSKQSTQPFTVQHTYQKSGYYTVTLKVSDSKGEQAMLRFVLLVNGEQDTSLISKVLSPDIHQPWQDITLIAIAATGLATAFIAGIRFARIKKPKA